VGKALEVIEARPEEGDVIKILGIGTEGQNDSLAQ
jgi:hypothetical protein